MEYGEKFIANENVLFETFVNDSFIKPCIDIRTSTYTSIVSPFKTSVQYNILELIVDDRCTQKCEYCYLSKKGSELYPPELDKSKENILKNLNAIMDYFTKQKNYLFEIYELYGGNLFANDLLFDCLDVLYPYFQYINRKLPDWAIQGKSIQLAIPCSYSQFVNDKKIVNKIFDYCDKFKRENVIINLSWSHDGKYSSTREDKAIFTDEFYDEAFKVCDKTNSGLHPMITPGNVALAIDNYKWWEEMFVKYLPNRVENKIFGPSCLELRDSGWTKENLKDYENYIQWRIENLVKKFDTPEDFCGFLYDNLGDEKMAEFNYNYQEILSPLLFLKTLSTDTMQCTMQNAMMIRCADLALVPCHRTCYPQFVGGWFNVDEEGKVNGLTAHNVSQMITMKTRQTNMDPVCCVCPYREFCLQGCLGSQYEDTGELYLPVLNVCEMQKTKILTQLRTFKNLGIFDIMTKHTNPYIVDKGNHLIHMYDYLTNPNQGGLNDGRCHTCC